MLEGIPTKDHLARIYYELSLVGATSTGEKCPWPYRVENIEELFCLGAEMSRYDPRLFSVLVLFLDQNWKKINPALLRSHYSSMVTPEVMAVMAEFLLSILTGMSEKRYFLDYLQDGLAPVKLQLFYQYLYRPGGNLMRRAVETSLKEYKRWGFLAREAPVLDEARRTSIGSRDASSRRNVLLELLRRKRRVRLADYIATVDGNLSRQQALLDIRSIDGVHCVGRGPSACWELCDFDDGSGSC